MEHFRIENLSFRYPQSGKNVLDAVNLSINQGDYVTICGRSGSGKSTLLLHLKTVLTPHGETSGDIFFCGKHLKDLDLRTQSSEIGFVMQNPDDQIVTDKVWHELAFGLENLGVEQKTIRLRVAEMANYFGIETWFHKNVAELSGGQKQLLNLASIMAMQPSVIILDEPTSQLDPIAAADFLNTVKKINLELGTTIIITEHRLENIFHCSDIVVAMEKGCVVAVEKPHKIGEILREKHSDIFHTMPAPTKIFYGVEKQGDCPLTVREGRNWLDKRYKNNPPKENLLEEEDFLENGTILELKELWFRYKKEDRDILKGLSLSVSKGQLFAIMGGNGAGKSTLLKAICGINLSYSGKIFVNGKDIKKYKKGELFRNNLVMLPQDPRLLFVHKTVKDDLLEMLDENFSEDEKIQKLLKVVADIECEELLEKHPFDLSGGEQQRVALAKVLLTEPKILLLDEPTKGIDSFFKEKLAEILKKLISEQGVTIIMVSHDIEFCAKYADSISMFFDSSILTTTTPRKFFSGNSFYTTAANRMSRHIFKNAITDEDVIKLCQKNSV